MADINTKLLTLVNKAANLLTEDEKAFFDTMKNRDPEESYNIGTSAALLANMAYYLEKDILASEVKKSPRNGMYAAAERFAKKTYKEFIRTRPALAGAWTENGRQYICSGYHAAIINNPIEALTGNGAFSGERMNVESCIKGIRQNDIEINLPSVAEIKSLISVKKSEWKAENHSKSEKFRALYQFGENMPYVDAELLLDIISIFPDANAYASKTNSMNTPIYFVCDSGEGILCPVRVNKK